MKNTIFAIVILILIALGLYVFSQFVKNDEFEGIDPGDFENQETESTTGQNGEEGQTNEEKVVIDELKAAILKEGTGQAAENGNQITVHYVGVLEDGTKFDSSLDREQPFVFTLGAGQVIPGWDLGLVGMKIGEIRRLYIPSELAYGETGVPNGPIPPKANLIFDVELLAIGQE